MNKNLLYAAGIVLVVALLAVGTVWAFSDKGTGFLGMGPFATTTPEQPTVCTMEAKICPDGTAVGRTGPNCEFAACPDSSGNPETEKTTGALNERIYNFGVHITPLEVVEDSRCPMGVYCIQAGTVRVKVKLEGPGGTQIETLTLGSPVAFGNKHVALISVTPPKSQTPIAPSAYRFTFSVAYGMGGDEQASGTLSGTMSIGPVCPVERADNPCKPTPEMYAAHKVAVYASDKKTLITTLTPSASGTFSATLPAGTYYVAMAATQSGAGSTKGVPTTITIKNGATTHLAIDIDTGIR